MADIALAWRGLAELTEQLIALHEDPWGERGAFLARASALTERMRNALDEAGSIVSDVPAVVHEEVRERLADTSCEALLLQVAILSDRPVA
jgi:hypothetical protein